MDEKYLCGQMIKQIHDDLEKRANNAMRKQDLTFTQVSALLTLLNFPEQKATLKELEKALHVAQSTTVGIVNRLEHKGLVNSFGDPSDRRIKLVQITPEGKQCCRQAQDNMKETEASLLSPLTKEEQKTFISLLRKVSKNLN
ncbi:MarR family transcriptional regulator [Allobaculum sp. JKK-2023]|uniref:MarR family winged helix-turn-helix transcriptional regulator n=1 Tax=Allobaculum sp. JKK-2023 TaxID=3108943 RepID=UPI002B062730|nr:MarR family transcriptional regulator [Allobaculum sp. JKK-2023]